MTEERQLVAAIHAAPREDTLRLAYADWLDERAGPGDAARAAFIRFGVAHPEHRYWVEDDPGLHYKPADGWPLFGPHWRDWRAETVARLGAGSAGNWLTDRDCRWAYRRGLVAVFEGTERHLLDAGSDVFRLGPVEEVSVEWLGHIGAVSDMCAVLGASNVRVVRLSLLTWHGSSLEWAQARADWFRRLDAVELRLVPVPGRSGGFNSEAIRSMREWLAGDPSLRHVSFLAW